MRGRLTLGAYLAFAFSALSVLLSVLLAFVIERTASDRIGQGIGANLAELANQTSTRLDRGLYERYREIQLLANRLGAGDRDWNAIQAELTAMQASYRYYAWIGVADSEGVVRAASRGLLVGENVGERPWYRNAQRGVHLGDVHEARLLARHLPGEAGELPRFLDVAFPLQASGPMGVIGAHVSWDWAKDVRATIFRPIARSQQLDPLIVDREGVVLLGPAGLEGSRLQLASLERARRGETGYLEEAWPDGKRYLVGFSHGRGHATSPGLGWSLLVRQELDDAYAPVREMQRSVLASGLAIAALFSLLGWLVASAITRPLIDLTASARLLDGGGVALVRPSTAYREVETLGTALNHLVGELQRNQSALRELNAELERRVDQRTEELRLAFERVRSNEQRIQTIIEGAQDPFIGMDLEGRITDWNSQAEVLFGWRRDEVAGRLVSDVLLPERFRGSLEKALRDYLATGESPAVDRPMERTLLARDGREIPVEVKIGLVATGEARFFSAFVHDISKRKEIERLKDEFVSTVSHELRTPLTAIYGSLDLLAAGMAGDLPDEARELVAISQQSTQRLVRLINEMLDVEKIASGKLEYRMQRQPLAPLVDQAMRDVGTYAATLGVSLQLVRVEEAEVEADADRIVQVCVNLLSNAAKFSPPGGMVEVALRRRGDAVRVSVADRGPGVPPEFRARIFDRFAQADASDTRAKGGTGLGLNICRSIVTAHGGTIGFDSDPGVRTEFWFELPLAPAGRAG